MIQLDWDMPTSCQECRFAVDGWCYALRANDGQPSELCYLTRPEWCPLRDAAPRWVRCEEALPDIGQRVIVYDGWMQFMTRKDDQRLNGKMYWENEEGNWERVDDEAYWMPIEPPKEEEHGN